MGKPTPVRATTVHDLTDDLQELVLLSLNSTVCLVRATATCKLWRCLLAGTNGAAFLRRFLSLHPPRPIGTFYGMNHDRQPCSYDQYRVWPEVDPVFVPSSASPSHGSTELQLSLDFVPPSDRGPRELVDCRGSLLLLLREKGRPERPSCMCCWHTADYMTPDLVVCEPLTRQYQAIPPPHDRVCILFAFLLDRGGAIGMTNFRVLLVLYEHETKDGPMSGHNGHGYPSASVFTSGVTLNGGWHHRWPNYDGVYLPGMDEIHLVGRSGGRIYWRCDDEKLMVLDERTLKFSNMALSEFAMDNLSDDLQTMELKREYGWKEYTGPAFPYMLPWPPVMRACVEQEEDDDLYDIHVLFST